MKPHLYSENLQKNYSIDSTTVIMLWPWKTSGKRILRTCYLTMLMPCVLIMRIQQQWIFFVLVFCIAEERIKRLIS